MSDLKVNVAEKKSQILYYIGINGPLVSQTIAKHFSMPSYLASALLSELLKDKSVKASHLRVGGSPLYYTSGQEDKLQNFTKFLEFREREALAALKEGEILEDSKLEPAFRVAYRNIKDFAMPFEVSVGAEKKLFWRFYLLSPEEASDKISRLFKLKPEHSAKKEKFLEPAIAGHNLKPLEVSTNEDKVSDHKSTKAESEDLKEKIKETKIIKPKKEKKPKVSAAFSEKVNEWVASNKTSVKEMLEPENKSVKAIVEVESGLGSLDFLMIAKDKKSVNEGDIALIYQEGADRKMPILFLTNGKLSKKSEEVLKGLKGQMIIRKL